jgi:hypothetical protein
MSYTEYLRRKAAAAPVVVDMRPKLDASSYTRQQRLISAGQSYNVTKAVIGNIDDMATAVSRDPRSVTARTQVSTTKTTAANVPDASSRTDFLGGQAILEARQTFKPTRVLMNSNSTSSGMAVTKGCVVVPEPAPQTNGTIGANHVQKGAGDWVRLNRDCVGSGRASEPHNSVNVPGVMPPLFVDDTISVNGVFGIGLGNKGVPLRADGNAVPQHQCPRVHHAQPAIVPRAGWQRRPNKGAGGLVVPSIPRPDDARKVGAYIPSDRLKYVEKHHGNDGTVNPRRIPIKYQIPAGAPAHLKINDP